MRGDVDRWTCEIVKSRVIQVGKGANAAASISRGIAARRCQDRMALRAEYAKAQSFERVDTGKSRVLGTKSCKGAKTWKHGSAETGRDQCVALYTRESLKARKCRKRIGGRGWDFEITRALECGIGRALERGKFQLFQHWKIGEFGDWIPECFEEHEREDVTTCYCRKAVASEDA